MAVITPQMVKELREQTGAGMADCKKALELAEGNMNAAVEELRKKGAASAAKRADRSANEGLIITKTTDDGKKSCIIEINCETDFVARNEEFVAYANIVAEGLMNNNPASAEDLLSASVNGKKIEDLHNEILAKFSEKITIGKFSKLNSAGYITDYIHAGSKLGVVADFDIANVTDEAKSLMHDIAMQIAAMNPMFVDRSQVTQATLDKEKEIYIEAALNEGKKPEIAERVAQGKIEKYYEENCLVDQTFVKDSKKTISDVIKEISKLSGSEVKVVSFLRYSLGS